MIAEKQRPGVSHRIVEDVERIREWVRGRIKLWQGPELDERVKGVDVKRLLRRKVIIGLYRGFGRSLGRKLGSMSRLGRSVARVFGF